MGLLGGGEFFLGVGELSLGLRQFFAYSSEGLGGVGILDLHGLQLLLNLSQLLRFGADLLLQVLSCRGHVS